MLAFLQTSSIIYYTPRSASAFLNKAAKALLSSPLASNRSKMVIRVIKVVLSIFILFSKFLFLDWVVGVKLAKWGG